MNKQIPAFWYNNELYIKVVPVKKLFHSTTIHEVVTRGDVFAVRLRDHNLTVIPGTAKITPAVIYYRPDHIQLQHQLPL